MFVVFFVKQKTAYEMRISDWSSDLCSSDLHRSDPDLQALHARQPMIAIWDDHEIAGNAWRGGAPGHDEASDGPWAARVEAALRAHDEWLPGRTEWTEDRRLRA